MTQFRHITDECFNVKKPTIQDISDMASWLGMSFTDEHWNNQLYLGCGHVGVNLKRTDIEIKLAQCYLLEVQKHVSSGKTLQDAWSMAMNTSYPEDDELQRFLDE